MDLCCFNRPFDDQSQELVHLETEAKLYLQDMIRNHKVNLVWSFMLMYENNANPNIMVMQSIQRWREYATTTIAPHERIFSTARELATSYQIDQKDAIHCACALHVKCDYFLTVDKKLIKRVNRTTRLKALDPLDYIIALEDRHDE